MIDYTRALITVRGPAFKCVRTSLHSHQRSRYAQESVHNTWPGISKISASGLPAAWRPQSLRSALTSRRGPAVVTA